MSQGERDSAVGNTIKLEEFEKLPVGLIQASISRDPYANEIDTVTMNKVKALLIRVVKHSNQDWNIYISEWNDNLTLLDNIREAPDYSISEKLTNEYWIKKVFNCSKQVMKLLTI